MVVVAKSILFVVVLFCTTVFAKQTNISDKDKVPLSQRNDAYSSLQTDGKLQPGNVADPHGDIARYRSAIKLIEDQEGVYDNQLLPEVIGLGKALNAQGEYELAATVFVRAVHLSRINKGLHHPDQMPVLMDLYYSYTHSEQWERAANTLDYLYALQWKTYGEKDPHLLPTIEAMIEWYIRASDRELSAENVLGLMKAHGFNNYAIRIIDDQPDADSRQLVRFLYTQAVISYRLELYRSRESSYVGPGLKKQDSTGYHLVKNLEQFSSTISPYEQGKKALSRRLALIMEDADADDAGRLKAMMMLGDWHFLFNRRIAAVEVYQQAHKLFANHATAGQLLVAMTGKPARLSFDLASKTGNTAKQQGYVVAQFKVNSAGKALNVKIIDANPPDMERETRQLLRTIRYSRFRPKLVAGKPIMFEGSTYKHSFEMPDDSSRPIAIDQAP